MTSSTPILAQAERDDQLDSLRVLYKQWSEQHGDLLAKQDVSPTRYQSQWLMAFSRLWKLTQKGDTK
jgi:hypothetical protein